MGATATTTYNTNDVELFTSEGSSVEDQTIELQTVRFHGEFHDCTFVSCTIEDGSFENCTFVDCEIKKPDGFEFNTYINCFFTFNQ